MKTSIKVFLVTIIFSIAAFMLSRVIWPPNPMMEQPSAAQLPYFIVLGAIEALAFGIGVSFLLFGWAFLGRAYPQKAVPHARRRALLMFIALTWFLVSWWPHDNFHQQVGMDYQGLLYIEYGFHLTLIISAVILAYGLVAIFKEIVFLRKA